MMWSVFLILVLLIPLVAVILDSRLGRALASRIEGGSPDNARLAALESEIDRLSAELERLQEETEFVTRLLEERKGTDRLSAGQSGTDRGGTDRPSADRPGSGRSATEPRPLPPDEAGG